MERWVVTRLILSLRQYNTLSVDDVELGPLNFKFRRANGPDVISNKVLVANAEQYKPSIYRNVLLNWMAFVCFDILDSFSVFGIKS